MPLQNRHALFFASASDGFGDVPLLRVVTMFREQQLRLLRRTFSKCFSHQSDLRKPVVALEVRRAHAWHAGRRILRRRTLSDFTAMSDCCADVKVRDRKMRSPALRMSALPRRAVASSLGALTGCSLVVQLSCCQWSSSLLSTCRSLRRNNDSASSLRFLLMKFLLTSSGLCTRNQRATRNAY